MAEAQTRDWDQAPLNDGSDDDRGGWGTWFAGVADGIGDVLQEAREQAVATAGDAKVYYDEHARDAVNAYSSQAAKLAGDLVVKAKELGQQTTEEATVLYKTHAEERLATLKKTAADAVEFAGEMAADAANAATATASDCYETVAPQVLEAGSAARAMAAATASTLRQQAVVLQEQTKEMSLDRFKDQLRQSMTTMHHEFTDLGSRMAAGFAEDQTRAGSTSEADGAGGAVDRPKMRDCPYASPDELEVMFTKTAAEVLASTSCSVLNDRVATMYEELFTSGAAACVGIYEFFDDFNGKLPRRKVELCVGDA